MALSNDLNLHASFAASIAHQDIPFVDNVFFRGQGGLQTLSDGLGIAIYGLAYMMDDLDIAEPLEQSQVDPSHAARLLIAGSTALDRGSVLI